MPSRGKVGDGSIPFQSDKTECPFADWRRSEAIVVEEIPSVAHITRDSTIMKHQADFDNSKEAEASADCAAEAPPLLLRRFLRDFNRDPRQEPRDEAVIEVD
jgi:hypothetical protein